MVTVLVQVLTLPFTSVTVNVTVLPLTLEQVKADDRLSQMVLVNNTRLSVQPVAKEEFDIIFTPEMIEFITKIVRKFDEVIEQEIFTERNNRAQKLDHLLSHFDSEAIKPNAQDFYDKIVRPLMSENVSTNQEKWKIDRLPIRLQDRRIDLGDVSPANTEKFEKSLRMSPKLVQGIQVRC